MRATIPEEIKQARWIVKERQEMLAEAKREADRILNDAREQAVKLASQEEVVRMPSARRRRSSRQRVRRSGRCASAPRTTPTRSSRRSKST